jgi:O-antigen/teichoic acid export membrane protein
MSIKKNMVSNFLLTSSKIIFPIITFPYITRTLSTESLGSVLFIDAFTQYFIIFSAIGIPLYGVREIAKLKKNPIERSILVKELLILKMALSLMFSLVFLILYSFIPSLQNNFDLIKIGCISILSSSFLIEWFYQGMEHYTFITIRTLIVKALSVLFILILVKSSDDKVIYYVILVGVNSLNALINFWYYLKKFHIKVTRKLSLKKHIKPLLILFSINIAVSVYTVLDTIILGTLTNPEEVSLYNVSLKLSKVVVAVVLGFGFVLIPKIARLYSEKNILELKALISKSFNIILLISLPYCFFSCFFSEEILFLISGDKYIIAKNSFIIASFLPFIIGVCNILGTQFLLPIGKEKKILHATLLGLITSIILNFIFIPKMGFLGAAYSCLLAEIAVCTYIFLEAKKKINLMIDGSIIIHIISSLIITSAFILLFTHQIKSIYLLFISFFFYCTTFISLQYFYFKNPFIFSIFKFRTIKHG